MPDESIYAYWCKGPGKAERTPGLLFAGKSRPADSFHLGIALRGTGKVVGNIWVYRIARDREATVTVRFGQPHQGRGFGTEALAAMACFCFEHTELECLRAEVDIRNIASRRMLGKCGFVRKGGIRRGKMVSVECEFFVYGLERTPRPVAEGQAPRAARAVSMSEGQRTMPFSSLGPPMT